MNIINYEVGDILVSVTEKSLCTKCKIIKIDYLEYKYTLICEILEVKLNTKYPIYGHLGAEFEMTAYRASHDFKLDENYKLSKIIESI